MTASVSEWNWSRRNVAALERSDNVADCSHAFAGLKRGYPRRVVIVQESDMRPPRAV